MDEAPELADRSETSGALSRAKSRAEYLIETRSWATYLTQVASRETVRFAAEICFRGSGPGQGRSMARADDKNPDGALAGSATDAYLRSTSRANPLKYIPGFLYVLVFFIVGKLIFADPRATMIQWGEYNLSWVEVLLVGAAMMAMVEQLRVSHPGIDNTIEAILMGAIAGIQILLFALGAAGVRPLAMFNNTEFLMLTVISMTQAVVAILINARTLRRTIGVGDNG